MGSRSRCRTGRFGQAELFDEAIHMLRRHPMAPIASIPAGAMQRQHAGGIDVLHASDVCRQVDPPAGELVGHPW